MKHMKKLPKLKKGAWFVRVRGSYLPMTVHGWIMHVLLLTSSVAVIASAYADKRDLTTVIISMFLELIGLGAIFTYLASKKA
jgi:heme/copper-type cytochrome/quinol oxidase subunit 3